MNWVFGLLLIVALSLTPAGDAETESAARGTIDVHTGTAGTKIKMKIETSDNPKVGLDLELIDSTDED